MRLLSYEIQSVLPPVAGVAGRVAGFDVEFDGGDPVALTRALLDGAAGSPLRLLELIGPDGVVWRPNPMGALAAVGAGPYRARLVHRDPAVHLTDAVLRDVLERSGAPFAWRRVEKLGLHDIEFDGGETGVVSLASGA